MNPLSENLREALVMLDRAADILSYSHDKCKPIQLDEGIDQTELESLDALTSRFARLSDILVQRVFRLIDRLDLEDDGTVRDRINRAYKKGLISSADRFTDIRLLRNEIAHEYKSDSFYAIVVKVQAFTPDLPRSVDLVKIYSKNHLT